MSILSIIVPVYNVENYIEKCISSISKQTFIDFKCIIVNDGSLDNSISLAQKLIENDSRFIIVEKQNGGLSDARNFGLKYVDSKYLTFLDSDDYIEYDYFKNAIDLAIKDDLDLVVSDLQYEYEDHSFYQNGLNLKYNSQKDKALFLSPLFSWNKIYKTEIFKKLNLQYPKGLWYEDIPVTLKYFSNVSKVGYLNKLTHHYVQRKNSIMSSNFNIKMYDIFEIFKLVINDLKQSNKLDYYKDEIEYLFIEHFMFYGAFRFLRSLDYKNLVYKGKKFVEEYFPNWKTNKYLKMIGFKNIIFVKTLNKFSIEFYRWYVNRGKN